MAITAAMRTQVTQLYVSMFGRAPEFDGLGYWVNQLNAGKSFAQVAQDMFNVTPSRAYYPSFLTNEEIIARFYTNVLGRTADAEGAAYWAAKLNAGQTPGQVITDMIASVANYAGSDEAALASQKLFADKVELGLYYAIDLAGNDVTKASTLMALVSSAGIQAAKNAANVVEGQTFTLTTGIDTIKEGTAGNDTITAVIDGTTSAVATTLTTLDSIDGGAGNDTMTLNIANGVGVAGTPVLALPVVTVAGVETINVRSAVDLTADTSKWTGVNAVNVTQGQAVTLTVGDGQAANVSGPAATKAVSVTGTTGNVQVTGTGNVTATTTTGSQTVTGSGTLTLASGTGNITATDTLQVGAIAIDGGNAVSLTTASAAATANTIKVGNTTGASPAVTTPAGAVTITNALSNTTAADATGGAITVAGGSTVSVTQTAAQAALATAGANKTLTQGAVTVNGTAITTSVTVNQAAAVAPVTSVVAVPGVSEVDTITVTAGLANNATATLGGLTFKNTSGAALTISQTAAAFANLKSGDTVGHSLLGAYSGTFATGWSTGAVTDVSTTSSTLTATNAVPATAGSATLTTGISGAAATLATAGVAAVAAAGNGGVVAGVVQILDSEFNDATKPDSITTASLSNYATTSWVKSDALTTLSLSGVKDGAVSVYNNVATALTLNVNGLTATTAGSGSTLTVDAGAVKYKSLAINSTVASSTLAITAAAVETLTVAGDKSVDLTGSTLTALKTVTISGAGGLTAATALTGTSVTDVNASAASGAVSASIDASKATYEGSTGADTITLTSTTVSKAVTLGAGNDKLTLAAGTTALAAVANGGDGTDTLSMQAADAATASAATAFQAGFTGFEKLDLTAEGTSTIDLSKLNNINYVVSNGTVAAVSPLPVAAKVDGGAGAAEATTYTIGGTTSAMTAGQSLTIDGVTLTATATLSNVQVAAAFAGTATTGAVISGTFTTPTTWGGVLATAATGVLTLTNTVNGDKTDFTTAATSAAGAVTLTKMANAGTLELAGAGAGTVTVTMTDATGTADSLNIVTKVNASDLTLDTVAAAGVETLNITATDTTPVTAGLATISKATLTVTDAAAMTVVITGESDLALTQASAVLTTVNASAATGKITFSSAVNSAVITGGSGNDVFVGSGDSQTLIGGAGNDTLKATGNLAILTGGTGNDTFDVSDPTTNVNNYATITDASAGDVIKFNATAATFKSAKVTLAATAVFQDYANAAIAATSANDVSWFQYGGDTYVVEHGAGTATSFTNNSDIIVKLTGLVDLSTATFNYGDNTVHLN